MVNDMKKLSKKETNKIKTEIKNTLVQNPNFIAKHAMYPVAYEPLKRHQFLFEIEGIPSFVVNEVKMPRIESQKGKFVAWDNLAFSINVAIVGIIWHLALMLQLIQTQCRQLWIFLAKTRR